MRLISSRHKQKLAQKTNHNKHWKGDIRMLSKAIRPLTKITITLALVACLCSSVVKLQSNAQTSVCSNQTGTHSGYFYTFWKDTGTACMTLGSGGNYDVSWNLGSGNMVVGKGWSTGSSSREWATMPASGSRMATHI